MKAIRVNWRQLGAILLLGSFIWLPRGAALERFVTTDEVIWLVRSANFYYHLSHLDFGSTLKNPSPGVITMWIETAAFLVEFPQYRGFGQGAFTKYPPFEAFLAEHGVRPLDILVTSRALMVLLITVVSLMAFHYARRLFGMTVAVCGFVLLAFDPYYIGITRLAHLDGPMASFLFLSLLTFLAYLLDGHKRLDLLLSAAAGALAVLSKIPAWLIVPTLGVVAVLDHGTKHKSSRASPGNSYPGVWAGPGKPLLLWGFGFMLVIFLALPAMWQKPVESFRYLALAPLGFAQDVITEEDESVHPLPTQELDSSSPTGQGIDAQGEINQSYAFQENPLGYFTRYPVNYLRLATPITLLGALAALLALVLGWGPAREAKCRQSLFGIAAFIVLYTLFMTIPPKWSTKYYLPVYPFMDLIAGLGWVSLLGRFTSSLMPRFRQAAQAAMLCVIALLQGLQAAPTVPYYLTYYNPLAGPNYAWGSGEGLDQAAVYLNAKPGAEQLRVMSWYGIGPFSYYFVGETIPISVGDPPWQEKRLPQLSEVDYLVTYNNQWKRDLPQGINAFLAGVEPEYRVWLNGAEYARVYAVDALPVNNLGMYQGEAVGP